MSASTDALFQPFRLKSLSLKNRIVMAPMTRSFSPDGVPVSDVAAYYRRRAAAEVGLILSEGTVIDRPGARNDPKIPFFHGKGSLAGWQAVIDAVTPKGAYGPADLARRRGEELPHALGGRWHREPFGARSAQ